MQLNFTGLHYEVDNKVWTKSVGTQDIFRNGDIWASTMSTDRVVRLHPKTGVAEQYLTPSDTNMRTVFVDNSTNPVSFWVGSNHDHALVKVEPLE